MPPFHNIKFSAEQPLLKIGERGKFLILLESVDASRRDEEWEAVGKGRAISQSAVESFLTT